MANPRRTTSTTQSLILLAAVVLILYLARDVLIPLALALTIGFALTPFVTALQRLRLNRVSAVIVAMLLLLSAVGGITWVVINQLIDVANDLPKYRQNIHDKIVEIHAPSGGAFGKAAQSMKEIGKELAAPATQPVRPAGAQRPTAVPRGQPSSPTPVQVVEPPQNDLQYIRDLLAPAVKPLLSAGIVLVFTIFILIKREDLRNRVLRLAGLSQMNVVTRALDDGAQRISRYLVMQFLVNAGYGALFGLGLFLIGVPNAPLWGVIAAILRLVPYVGSLVAAALPLITALAVFNSWVPPVLVFVLYAVLEGLVGNFLEPWLYGAHTGVSSLALLVTTVFWTLLWGWAGLVLSTPLSVCVIILGRYIPQWSFLHILLGDEDPLPAHVVFYQRLLALDQSEARSIAIEFLKGKTLVDLYDKVVVPALSLAEQDRHKGQLDETRENFVFLSATELISELVAHAEEGTGAVADAGPPQPGRLLNRVNMRIVCIPANDQADEITSAMLAQVLEQDGRNVLALPLNQSWEDSLKHLALEPDDVVCISSLPPFAFTRARSICQRLRALLPDSKIVVGLWGFAGETSKLLDRFGSARPNVVVTTLADVLAQVVNPTGATTPESTAVDEVSTSNPPTSLEEVGHSLTERE